MTNRNNRAAFIALLAVFACALIGAGIGLHRVKSSYLRELRHTLISKQTQLKEARERVKQIPELQASYEELSNQVAILEPRLPAEAYIPTFLSQIQALALETDNSLTLIRPRPKRKAPAAAKSAEADVVAEGAETSTNQTPAAKKKAEEEKSPYDMLEIDVELEGTYWSALNFLEKLRAFPKMIAVNELSLKPKNAQKGAARSEPLMDIALQFTAVMAKEK